MDDINWSYLDAERLQQLRRVAGLSVADLAKMSGISEAQIAQLEEGGDSLFYSARIKFSVGKRVILQLIQLSQNALNSSDNPQKSAHAKRLHSNKDAHQSLKAIEEMSRRNLDARPVTDFYWSLRVELVRFFQSKYVLASLGMLILMVVVMVLESPQPEGYEAKGDETHPSQTWTKSVTAPVFVASDWLGAQWSTWLGPNNTLLAGLFERKDALQPQALKAGLSESFSQPFAKNQDTSPSTVALDDQASKLAQDPVALECQFNPGGGTEVFSTSTFRPATYVYLVAKKDTTVCIQDGQHITSQVKLAMGASQSVFGAPPWHLRLQDLDAIDVFFQGHRIVLPPSEDPQFTLRQFAQDSAH